MDEDGVFQGTRPMIFPGAPATYLEGMAYLPPSSPFYPDHLIVVANWFGADTLHPRIEVVQLDGTVVAEIVPQPFGPQPDGSFLFDPTYTLLGLSYKSPDRLLVTLNDGTDNVWELDLTGNVVGGGPVYTGAGEGGLEGIVQVADGRIIVSNYFTGNLLFFDANMSRLPDQDRTYSVGIGLARLGGIAWSTDTNSHLDSEFRFRPEPQHDTDEPRLRHDRPASRGGTGHAEVHAGVSAVRAPRRGSLSPLGRRADLLPNF